MNELSIIPPEHFLTEHLRAVRTRLEAQSGAVHQLKETIVAKLLAWQEDLQGGELDEDGTFVYDGIRERLEALLPEDIDAGIRINHLGWVSLHDKGGNTIIGTVYVGTSDPALEIQTLYRYQEHKPRLSIFMPYECNRYIPPDSVTNVDGPGPFLLSKTEALAAGASMAAHRITHFLGIANTIRDGEQPDEYRDLRVNVNVEDALKVCDWVMRAIPPPPQQLEQI